MPDPADTALLERARSGDVDAFVELVRRFERPIRSVLVRMLDDERDVEEAAQDTFVQAWRTLERFRGDAAPFTWLYRIAVNEALQRLRRKRLDTRPLEQLGGGSSLAEAEPAWTGPEASAEIRELGELLEAGIRTLTPDFRAAILLRDVIGLSNGEVAEALGLTVPAAKSRIHRARMQLRAALDQTARGLDHS